METIELYCKWKLFTEIAPVVLVALIAIFLLLLFTGAAIIDLLDKFKKVIEKEEDNGK